MRPYSPTYWQRSRMVETAISTLSAALRPVRIDCPGRPEAGHSANLTRNECARVQAISCIVACGRALAIVPMFAPTSMSATDDPENDFIFTANGGIISTCAKPNSINRTC
jgi:hypothetical protein